MKKNIPGLSIIIVSYNNPKFLLKTIDTINQNVKFIQFEIIVVDNASTDNNVNLLRQKFPEVRIIENSENKGFASACNQGADISKGDFLLFVNSDIIFKADPLPELYDVYKNYKNIGLVGCKLLNEDGSTQTSYYSNPSLLKRFLDLCGLKKIFIKYRSNNLTSKFKEVDIVKGALFLIKKDLFVQLSGFDENYFMYVEDVDLSYRAQKLGKKNYIVNTDTIIHLGWHPMTLNNSFAFYNGNLSLLYFYKKNKSLVNFILFLLISTPIFFIYLLIFVTDSRKRDILYRLLKVYTDSMIHLKSNSGLTKSNLN